MVRRLNKGSSLRLGSIVRRLAAGANRLLLSATGRWFDRVYLAPDVPPPDRAGHLFEAFTAYGQEVVAWDVMMPMDPPTPVTVVLNDDHPAGRYTADLTLPGNEPFRLYVEDGEFVVR